MMLKEIFPTDRQLVMATLQERIRCVSAVLVAVFLVLRDASFRNRVSERRILAGLLLFALPAMLFAAQDGAVPTREISWDPAARIVDRLLPDDKVVELTRDFLDIIAPAHH